MTITEVLLVPAVKQLSYRHFGNRFSSTTQKANTSEPKSPRCSRQTALGATPQTGKGTLEIYS